MERFLLLAGLAGALLLCGYLLGRTARTTQPVASGTTPSADTGAHGDDSRIMFAIAGIEQRLEVLESRPASVPVQATAIPSALEREPPPSVQDMNEEIRAHRANTSAKIEERLATEPRDNSWATAAEEQLRHAARACSGDTEVTTLSCRTSI